MKQIELRLALVLYGGVSLAVHMHGITREFLNLVRASRRMEARLDLGAPVEPEAPVTAAYEAFLSLLAPKLDLRVVIDVISGASAGGNCALPLMMPRISSNDNIPSPSASNSIRICRSSSRGGSRESR